MDQLNLHTTRYRLDIELGDRVGRAVMTDSYSGVKFADGEYRYSAVVECAGKIAQLEGLWNPTVSEERPDRGGRIVTISGRLGGPDSEIGIEVKHRFYIPDESEFFEEQILLRNPSEKHIALRSYRFAFRKLLQPAKNYGGSVIDVEDYRIIALPFRLQPDGKKHDYQLDDVYHGRYQCSEYSNPTRVTKEVVDRGRARSEGWAWTDGENGLLTIKYNPAMIEFSMLETERVAGEAYLNFGGAAPALYDEPFEATKLGPGLEIGFGQTHYLFYEGLWRRGAYLFRDYMSGLGHGLPDNYNPPVTWTLSPDARSIEEVDREAARASEIGCEALYLGSAWEGSEGHATWDDQRLGEAEPFVRRIKSDYGLDVGVRVIGRSYRDDYPGLYRRTFDGNTGYYAPYSERPFHEPCISCEECRQEMLRRILALADSGTGFMVFDEFDWRGPCFDGKHGHKVPTAPGSHAHAVSALIHGVREQHPNMLIEAHDPVWPWGVRYLPIYYLHDAGKTFDEGWAFELSRNPIEHLMSGRALSLFYYRLAYDLPLYLQLNMDADNDACLAFWWYASTVRHLGISGGRGDERRYAAYKQAMDQYMPMKQLYASGEFYAIDELTHFHVLPETGHCVLNAFNLTDTPISRTIEVRLSDMGMMAEVDVVGAESEMIGSKLAVELYVPPFSPLVVKIFAKGS